MGTKEIPIEKKLFEILESVDTKKVIGRDVTISGITIDSRQVQKRSLFCAIIGSNQDGHDYINKAVENKASVILCSDLPKKTEKKVTYVLVKDTRLALEQILLNYYENISTQLSLIGVTGTNGKTTIVSLLADLFSSMGYKVGLISTVEIKIGDDVIPAELTTPDIVSLNGLLYQMVKAQCEYVFMEVSSHAIDQNRIGGLEYRGAVFTNISHDHLDYHKTFKNYINTKKKFFDNLSKSAFALTNIDDKNGEVMVQNTKAKISKYSAIKIADFKAKTIASDLRGTELDLNRQRVFTNLVGQYNVYNLTAVYGVASLLGIENEQILIALSGLKAPKGRFEMISGLNQTNVIVDYAHTPDALLKIIQAITDVTYHGRIITVIGCGGDRDKTKRPIMAKVAVDNSDQVIFTSDNPRGEDPQSIIDDMIGGVSADQMIKVVEIADRKNAIKTAIRLARNEDIVLIAGKGHENYQEIKGKRNPFNDAEIARSFLVQ